MEFYERPGFGYQVILFVQPGVSPGLRESKYLGIHPTLSSIFELLVWDSASLPSSDRNRG